MEHEQCDGSELPPQKPRCSYEGRYGINTRISFFFFFNPVNHQLLMSFHAGLLQELIQGWCCFPDSALLPSLPSAKQGGLSLTEIN